MFCQVAVERFHAVETGRPLSPGYLESEQARGKQEVQLLDVKKDKPK